MPSGHDLGESDTNRLAQGEASESHDSLIKEEKIDKLIFQLQHNHICRQYQMKQFKRIVGQF